MEKTIPNKKIVRRCLGVLLCSLPTVLALACAMWPRSVAAYSSRMGLVLVLMAFAIGLANIFWTFVRPWLHQRKHGSMESYRFVSGLPLVGTLLQIAGCVTAFGDTAVGLCAVLATLLDTGGLLWIPLLTWNDDSLWDA
ncbi:MAG: hypothetical protein BWK76_15305 [Desulfobulbaceae bacterium A2]|nr:MAG: hypothetical protein BWK76_15305 [Desulfobulbaceae bacterium A2]